MTMSPSQSPSAGLMIFLSLVVLLAAVFFRTGLLMLPAEFDELYHLLAARSWMETGQPEILDGEYSRAWIYTAAVAWLFEATGSDTLFTGRLLSVALCALVPVALLIWGTRVGGLGVGLVAALFAIFWPRGMLDGQLLRFYSAHALFFTLGALFFYMIFEDREDRDGREGGRGIYAVLAIACWALAFHFQLATIFGVMAALIWLALVMIYERAPSWSSRGLVVLGLLALGAAGLGGLYVTGILEEAWAMYRWTPQHNAEMASYYGFYFNQLERYHGYLWYATPLLALLALAVRPKLALFALILFFVPFLAHSFGGMKALRYISYATPFLFILWAVAIVNGISALVVLVSRQPAGADLRVPTAAAVLVVMALVVGFTGFVARGFELLRGQGVMDRGDWSTLTDLVDDWPEPAFIATTRELHYLTYGPGEIDVILSSSRVSELSPPEDFNTDPRLGLPAVGSEAAFEAILACHRDGLLVANAEWTEEMPWAAEIAAIFNEAGLEAETVGEGPMVAWRWSDPAGTAPVCDGQVAEMATAEPPPG